MSHQSTRLPQPLRAALSLAELADNVSYDGLRALSSYWSRHDDTDLQSQLVRYLKEPRVDPLRRPCVLAMVRAYGAMLAGICSDWKVDAVVRVLASAEKRAEPERPHTILARVVCDALHAPDFSHLFFRTEPRKPMRMLDRFGGPDVLRRRIAYVLQDLFVTPARLGGSVLVVDDIFNLGATARVYAAALKRFCGAERVYVANIAAARFSGGKDGWGYLALDVERFARLARANLGPSDPEDAFDDAWLARGAAAFHAGRDCTRIAGKIHRSFRFLACRDRVPCPACGVIDSQGGLRRWLKAR